MDTQQAEQWAQAECGQSDLGHGARTKRLVRIMSELVVSPGSSIPKAIGDPGQIKAAYRFLSNPAVTPQGVLSGHYDASGKRCMQHDVVLVLQDTTTLKFNSRDALQGMGPTNDGAQTKGFFAHSSLAVSADGHEVMGVLHVHLWSRDRQKKPANETSRQRKLRPRESMHWADNQKQVAQVLARAAEQAGRPAPRVIAVFDREGDIFEAMEVLDELGHSFVIRAIRNRALESRGATKRYGLTEACKAPVLAHKQVEVRGRGGKPERVAKLRVRALGVKLQPPRSRYRKGENLALNIVVAREEKPPAGVTPLCWYLLTREPIDTAEQVLAIVRHYEARWIIEEYHMGLKTGCGCEQRQLETPHALQNFLAVATPIAVELLRLRDGARREIPLQDCDMITPVEMEVLRQLRPRMMAKVTTARELMRVVANLGGFMNRNSDPDPGWRTLWRGYEELRKVASGYELRMRNVRPASPHAPRQARSRSTKPGK